VWRIGNSKVACMELHFVKNIQSTVCDSWQEVVKTRCRWFMPVILATQEAEMRRTTVRSQPRQIVCETLSQKKIPTQKK
jgi:hypothetical protein